VTEIPEHLLKRSRERRAALGGGSDEASGGDSPAATTPAVTTQAEAAPAAATAPAGRAAATPPAAPPPPKPDRPVVVAAKSRRRIPFWAMAALGLMPVWAFMYARSLTDQVEAVEGPLGMGAEVYGGCASCHGGSGEGGVGYAFTGGEVLATFPHIEDQLRYVYFGTGEYNLAGVEIYGNPEREGGPHVTGALGVMPAFGPQLTQYEIISVVCHERYTLGGADPTSAEWAEEYETWCSEEAPVFTAVEGGEYDYTSPESDFEGVQPVGPEPIAGSPAEAAG
jgi:mono/diheme cytochrome c family protein